MFILDKGVYDLNKRKYINIQNVKLDKQTFILSVFNFKNANQELIHNYCNSKQEKKLPLLLDQIYNLNNKVISNDSNMDIANNYRNFLTLKQALYLPELILVFTSKLSSQLNLNGYPFTLLEVAEIM